MDGKIVLDTTVALFFGGIIVAILGFFLVRTYNIIDKLTDSIQDFNSTIKVLQERDENRDSACKATHQVINERLNNHSAAIKQHDKEIAEIKVKIE